MRDRPDIRLLIGVQVALVTCGQARAEEPGKEIVVTARRQEERNITVPLAVSTVPADAVGAGSVESLQSLASHVPGLYFEAVWGGWNSFPTLRGQTQPSAAGDAVAMFVDGVYQANHDAIDVDPLDLERIEVVKGPQSALFGHSAFAGLINYVPAQATEVPRVSAAADVGTDALLGLQGAMSGPLSRLFKARLAVSWRRSDGTWENAAEPGQHPPAADAGLQRKRTWGLIRHRRRHFSDGWCGCRVFQDGRNRPGERDDPVALATDQTMRRARRD